MQIFKKLKKPPPSKDVPLHDYSKSASSVPLDKTSGLPLPPRTPSPTPSDIEELKKGALDWKKIFKWSTWAKKKYIGWYIALAITIAIITLISVYTTQLVNWLRPTAEFLKKLPAGWTIPIVIMFILSFPPLFGQEIIAILCGIVWGLWIGFGIVAAGTFIGEIGNFYAFRYCCQARGDKLEKTNMSYACLAKVIRDGGFRIALVARYSAIPGHFTTAIFSTCGMGIWEFSLGAFLSLPKQFATVYIGVIIHEAADGQSTQEKIVSAAVLVVTTLVTIFAMWWILKKMDQAKAEVLRDRRRQRAYAEHKAKMQGSYASSLEAGMFDRGSVDGARGSADNLLAGPFNPSRTSFQSVDDSSNAHLPLPLSVKPQRWDENGRAIPDFGLDERSQYGQGRKPSLKVGERAARSPSPPVNFQPDAPNIMVTSPSYPTFGNHHGGTAPGPAYGFEDRYDGRRADVSAAQHHAEPTDASYRTAYEHP